MKMLNADHNGCVVESEGPGARTLGSWVRISMKQLKMKKSLFVKYQLLSSCGKLYVKGTN
jgi:hypothetical protein